MFVQMCPLCQAIHATGDLLPLQPSTSQTFVFLKMSAKSCFMFSRQKIQT